MAVQTTQQVYPGRRIGGNGRVLVVRNGTVTVEVQIGANWATDGTYSEGAYRFENNRATVRVTPDGTAEYEVV